MGWFPIHYFRKFFARTYRFATIHKARNGRLGGHRAETGSRNMAATQKMNFFTLVSYSLLQTLFR